MSRRIDRVEEACKEELSELLQKEVKDPRVGFVTITRVKVSADLRHAKVYVSVLGEEDEAEQSLEGLNSARGFLKTRLGKHLRLKNLPDIEFVRERVSEDVIHLTEIMKKSEPVEENEGTSD
ncbi:MAG: 30S ribosome-binding factor RbfA [Actinobacteria bacterium]|nr:30S ribosome-binding factor RbfA [Actinomycetota bacterium]